MKQAQTQGCTASTGRFCGEEFRGRFREALAFNALTEGRVANCWFLATVAACCAAETGGRNGVEGRPGPIKRGDWRPSPPFGKRKARQLFAAPPEMLCRKEARQ
jgi:hypothetical protein